MHRTLRPAFVLTFGVLGGCCPAHIEEGESCWVARGCEAQGQPGNCGLNGFRCTEGKWKGEYTMCNPAAPDIEPSASALRPVDRQHELASLPGKQLSEVVTALGLREATFRYQDEPPGKLRVIRVALSPAEELEIHLDYDAALLFSDRREWPLSRIGAATVRGLRWRRGDEERSHGQLFER